MKLNGIEMMIALTIGDGNPGALACWAELAQREDRDVLSAIACQVEFRGHLLYLLWNDCCERNADQVAETLKGLSYNRLVEIRRMLEKPPLGIQEARLALGVSEVAL
jgi:hypothetical protein